MLTCNVSMTVIRLMYSNRLDSTWRVCNKKQDLLSLCESLGSPTVFSGDARVAHLFSFLCCVVLLALICLFIFVLGFVYPMLPVSLDCPFGFL